MLRTTEW